MAILSKNTTIGGKKPLTTDITSNEVSAIIQTTLTGDIDLNNITTPGSYIIKDVVSFNNFPYGFDIARINVGINLSVIPKNDTTVTQMLFARDDIYVRNFNGNDWLSWTLVTTPHGDYVLDNGYLHYVARTVGDGETIYLHHIDANGNAYFMGNAQISGSITCDGGARFTQDITVDSIAISQWIRTDGMPASDWVKKPPIKFTSRNAIIQSQNDGTTDNVASGNGAAVFGGILNSNELSSTLAYEAGDTSQVNYRNSGGGRNSIILGGLGNETIGTNSMVGGELCKVWVDLARVSGKMSHATVNSNIAEGGAIGADVHGLDLRAYFPWQTVRGKYNLLDNSNNFAFILGGGDNALNRKNITTIDWAGNAEFLGKIISNGTDILQAITNVRNSVADKELNFNWTQLVSETLYNATQEKYGTAMWQKTKFELRPNMIFAVKPGDINLHLFNSNNDSELPSTTNVGFCIGICANLGQYDGATPDSDQNKFGCMFVWQKSSSLISSSIGTLRFVLSDVEGERAYLVNDSEDSTAGVIYIKKGTN